MKRSRRFWPRLLAAVAGLSLTAGCVSGPNWNQRIGKYTYDDALREFGPPDRIAATSDGMTVAEWATNRSAAVAVYGGPSWGWRARYWGPPVYAGVGFTPEYGIRLTFGVDHRLFAARKYSR